MSNLDRLMGTENAQHIGGRALILRFLGVVILGGASLLFLSWLPLPSGVLVAIAVPVVLLLGHLSVRGKLP